MLHRMTWVAIPIVGLVLVGTGTGWWGYQQYQSRQALALQTQNQYNSDFHSLVDHVDKLRDELGKAVVTSDVPAFDQRLRNIWRLSYAAQTEAGKLPFELMPMHNTQHYLAMVSRETDRWMNEHTAPTEKSVHDKVTKMYQEAGTIAGSLTSMQAKAFDHQIDWTDVDAALNKNQQDNQVVDGFRKIDASTSAFVEAQDPPSSTQRGKTFAMAAQKDVGTAAARKAVIKVLGLPENAKVSVTTTKPGAYRPEFIVTGTAAAGPFRAVVSKDGGHVLSFDIRHNAMAGDYGYEAAQSRAEKWLTGLGFGDVTPIQSNQYDHVGYFIFAPVRDNAEVISQGITVKVALDSGQIVGFDANNYYYFPVKQLPARKYTAAALRAKLNPALEVGEERSVIVLDKYNRYQPAVAFYGTSHDQTYRVYMNANTGKEIDIEELT